MKKRLGVLFVLAVTVVIGLGGVVFAHIGDDWVIGSGQQQIGTHESDYTKSNLKVGKTTDKDSYFEAEITPKGSSFVDRILVSKHTGSLVSAYQRTPMGSGILERYEPPEPPEPPGV